MKTSGRVPSALRMAMRPRVKSGGIRTVNPIIISASAYYIRLHDPPPDAARCHDAFHHGLRDRSRRDREFWPGLDVLGCAVEGLHDRVWATRLDEPGICIDEPGHPDLPSDPEKHASAIAAAEVLRRAGAESVGVALTIEKGLPVAGGQGGSAASAVAGAVATNALIGHPLSESQLIEAALAAETIISGRVADNIAPILLGGIILVRDLDPLDIVRLPVPDFTAHRACPSRVPAEYRPRAGVLPTRIDRRRHFIRALKLGPSSRRSPRETWSCWDARSTTGSLNRPGHRCCQALLRQNAPPWWQARWGARFLAPVPRSLRLTDSDATAQLIAAAHLRRVRGMRHQGNGARDGRRSDRCAARPQ